MSDTYNLFQQGRTHLREGMAAQATVPLEKAKRREPEKASIREALGIAYFRIHRYEEAESALSGRRLRALRARPLPGEAGAPDRGPGALQARKFVASREQALLVSHPRRRLAGVARCRSARPASTRRRPWRNGRRVRPRPLRALGSRGR